MHLKLISWFVLVDEEYITEFNFPSYFEHFANISVAFSGLVCLFQAVLFGGESVLGPARDIEHPITVQLGGSCPERLAKAAKICEDLGYDEINLNVSCIKFD